MMRFSSFSYRQRLVQLMDNGVDAGAALCWEACIGSTAATAALLCSSGRAAVSPAVALEMAWAAVSSTLYTAQLKQW
jgi:hypothetical protein